MKIKRNEDNGNDMRKTLQEIQSGNERAAITDRKQPSRPE